MDAFINPTKQQHQAPPNAPEFDHGDGAEDYFDDDFSDDDYGDDDGMGGGGGPLQSNPPPVMARSMTRRRT